MRRYGINLKTKELTRGKHHRADSRFIDGFERYQKMKNTLKSNETQKRFRN